MYAEIGKGRYVYTCVRVVPTVAGRSAGAYRQFANLVSLSKAQRKLSFMRALAVLLALAAMGLFVDAATVRLGGAYGESAPQSVQTGDVLSRARALHKQVPLIDGHNDYPWALREQNAERDLNKLDIRMPQPKIHTDIPRLRAGGVGGQFWSVYVPRHAGPIAVRATFEQIDVVHRMVRKYPDTFELARTAADMERIFKAGRIASLIGMEGGIRSTTRSRRCACSTRGRRLHDPHPQHEHRWADSGTDKPKLGGLSKFGEEVVREMNRLGMLVDLSHTAPETMLDAIRVREAPVIFSHSDARASQRPWPQRPR